MSIRFAKLSAGVAIAAIAATAVAAGMSAARPVGSLPATRSAQKQQQTLAGVEVGRFEVEACTEAVGFQNNSWTVSTNNGDLETHTSCGEAPAPYQSTTIANLELADVLGLSKEIPVGAEGAWKITALQHETITEVTGYSSLFRNGGDAWQVYRQSEAINGEVTVEQTCKGVHTDSCGIGGLFQATGLHARSVTFGARCEAEEYEPGKLFTTCPDGALLHDVRAGIDYATVTLEDLTPPSNIVASGMGGAQHGTININGSATDDTAGLLSLNIINNNGQTVAGPVSVPGGCDYSKLTPCPTTATELPISIDLESLPEGENQLRIAATNAAHDEGISAPFVIDVQHPKPPEEPPKHTTEEPAPDEQTGSQGGSSGTSTGGTTSGGGDSTSKSTAKRPTSKPPLVVHLKQPRIVRHRLVIAATLSSRAGGQLHLTMRTTARHRWMMLVPIRDGRLRTSVSLPRRLCPRVVLLKLAFPGDRHYRATTIQRQLAVQGCAPKRSVRR